MKTYSLNDGRFFPNGKEQETDMENYKEYLTEQQNEASMHIDRMSALEIAQVINKEDKKVADAVETQLPSIARAIDEIAARLKNGGRLVYIGAGTSGRLGVIDATECPPTYGVSPELVQGIIAGGKDAMFYSAEGAEDSAEHAVLDLKKISFSEKDVCFGLSASGSAAYVCGALRYAKELGALTVALSCRGGSAISQIADIAITPEVGAEVISGSTRMKAATAQKMVLTTVSTGVMVKLGRVSGNLMVYMHPSNIKLKNRAVRMIVTETGASEEEARQALEQCGYSVSDAIARLRGSKA